MSFLSGATACLDFQYPSKEIKSLLSKDRIGMSKAELLSEMNRIEYAYYEQLFERDGLPIPTNFFCVYVIFPSNISERICSIVKQAKYRDHSKCIFPYGLQPIEYIHMVPNGNAEQYPFYGSWIDLDSTLKIRVYSKEWKLFTVSDFEDYLDYSLNLDYPPLVENAVCNRDWASFLLRESCCWAIYQRYYDGNTYQLFGALKYDLIVVEFDSSDKVIKQYKISGKSPLL